MKKRRFNKNGFTLIEIIVSIAIFSAVIAVLGSVMISGFKYFYETSNTDLDKRSIDQLSSYVREQLLYATDVKIQNSKPEGKWYSISVVDNKLHHYDQDEIDLNAFNNDSYYNGHSFKMTVKAYENNRLDLSYSMLDGTEALYTTRDTLELMNVTSIENAPFADEKIVGQDDLKIYYKKDKTAINNSGGSGEDSPFEVIGTVADQISDITLINGRYMHTNQERMSFEYGDFYYYEGYWWKFIDKAPYTSVTGKPGDISYHHRWKKIDAQWMAGSGYEYGDIVQHNGKYYRCVDKNGQNITDLPDYEPGQNYWMVFWEEITNSFDNKIPNVRGEETSETTKNKRLKTVIKELPNSELELEKIPIYNSSHKYSIGDVVKIDYHGIYKYFKKIVDNNIGPGEKEKNIYLNNAYNVGWKTLSVDWDDCSAYEIGDIVFVGFDEIYYVQVGDKAGIINYGTSYADYTYSGKIQLSFVKEENVYFQAAYLNQGQGEAEGAYLNWYIKSVIQ